MLITSSTKECTSNTKRIHDQNEIKCTVATLGSAAEVRAYLSAYHEDGNSRCLLRAARKNARAARKECMSGTKRIHDQHEIKCTEAILSLKAEVRSYLSAYHENGNSQPIATG